MAGFAMATMVPSRATHHHADGDGEEGSARGGPRSPLTGAGRCVVFGLPRRLLDGRSRHGRGAGRPRGGRRGPAERDGRRPARHLEGLASSATATAPWCAGWPLDHAPDRVADIAVAGRPGTRAANAGQRRPGPGSGRRGTGTTGSGTCRTWSSAGSVAGRPGRSVVRCADRLGGRGNRAQRLLRTGHREPPQLRRDRRRSVRIGQLRARRQHVPQRYFRRAERLTRRGPCRAEKMGRTSRGDVRDCAAYDVAHG
ncbi:hypothetical protein SBADM41S_12307 [Streptomyces badius]